MSEVNQSGWTRTFTYDSLSRLTQAANPEIGTVSYTYDSVGNPLTRTDSRGIQTTNSYDALNRILSVSYSDGTAGVSYSYDPGIANGKGRLGSVADCGRSAGVRARAG